MRRSVRYGEAVVVSDREMVIHVPDHSLSMSGVDDAVVDAFLEWFKRAGPDEVYEVESGDGQSTYVQKRNITQVRVNPHR
jgi:hypothetical protein